jgi:hypothetical protein
MRFEFTAVYQTHADGWITAYVAEKPKIATGAQSLEEARAALVAQLRGELEFDRDQGLRAAAPDARIECLCVETSSIPACPAPGQPPARPGRPAYWTHAEAKFFRQLHQQGLIDQIPDPLTFDADDFEPVPIEGRPISEEIIEGRR